MCATDLSQLNRMPGLGGTSQAIFREETTILIQQNRSPADLLVEDTPNTNKSFVSCEDYTG